MVRTLTILLLLLTGVQARAADFPRPQALEPAVAFWTRVYTEVSTDQGYIHDDEILSVIYRTVDLPDARDYARREKVIADAREAVIHALTSLGKGVRSGLTPVETEVLAAWPAGTPSLTFAQAAGRVRFQLGQADRFREGLVRSGQWKPHIHEVLAKYHLPEELDVLPHVESSYNPAAWSKAGAAGMWQFMPATGRQYMQVDHVVDGRMDPFIATDGAARLLQANYRITGTWPLALTGYNHGAGGMARAAKSLGTTDIDVIVKHYKGQTFGFASRNFYASFLAALQVDRDAEHYFPGVKLAAPVAYDVVEPEDYIAAQGLAEEVGVSLEELRRYNPALLDPVWTGEKYIPQGFPVRLPSAQLGRPLEQCLASLSIVSRFGQQKPDRVHRIVAGDSLSTIARRYGTTVSKLMALNGLRSANIRAGKSLILPGGVEQSGLTAAQVAMTRARLDGKPVEYVIQEGDSLWSIARRFNVSTQQLLAWNGISAKSYIQPGQKLKIVSAG